VCISDFSIGTRVAVLCFLAVSLQYLACTFYFLQTAVYLLAVIVRRLCFLPLPFVLNMVCRCPTPHFKRTPVLTTTSIFLRPLVPFSSSHVHRPSLNPSSLSLRPDRPLSKDTPFHFSPIIRSLGGLTAVRLIIPPRRPYIPVIFLLDMVIVFICVHL
jgi:hypothetical protein